MGNVRLMKVLHVMRRVAASGTKRQLDGRAGDRGRRRAQATSRFGHLRGRAWDRRTLSPLVWQTWAWWSSRSTVAVARVLGMKLVERAEVQVARDGDAAFLVGGVNEPVEAFGGVGGDGQQTDVVDDDEIGAARG